MAYYCNFPLLHLNSYKNISRHVYFLVYDEANNVRVFFVSEVSLDESHSETRRAH